MKSGRILVLAGLLLALSIYCAPRLAAFDKGTTIGSNPTTTSSGQLISNVNLGRVRAKPDLASEILFRLRAGKTYHYTDFENGWYHIVLTDGRSGWAHHSIFEGESQVQQPIVSALCAEAEGLIAASELLEISSKVDGVLDEVLVDRGDWVTAGQTLAMLTSKVQQAAVELARARVEFGRRKTQRNKGLFQKDLISMHQKDELETELQIAELEYLKAQEELRLRKVTSPLRGVVVERYLSAGEQTSQKPILKMARVDPLYVEVIAPKACYRDILVGMRAEVRPEAPVNGKYLSRVEAIDPLIDAGRGTFGIRLTLPNPKNKLPAGIRCQVRFLSR